jgi:hypothetical protein
MGFPDSLRGKSNLFSVQRAFARFLFMRKEKEDWSKQPEQGIII